ncbi:MAG: ATP-binding protein, partial [Polyangiaceae bacterium]
MPVLIRTTAGGQDSSAGERELAGIFNDGPIPLFVQRGGVIAYSNTCARREFGEALTAGRPSFLAVDKLHPDDRVRFGEAEKNTSGGVGRFVVRLETDSGTYRQILVTMFAADFGGPAVAYVARDVSVDLAEQAKLVLAGRAASAATLATGVAHEINNPLATVLSNIEFLRDQLASFESLDGAARSSSEIASRLRHAKDALEDIRASATRIEGIVRDLRAFAPPRGDEHITIDVNDVVQLALRQSHGEVETRARLISALGEPLFIEANPGRLAQAISSVLANAAEAIAQGAAEKNEVRIVTYADGDFACIEISDSGRGVTAEIRSRMFDPFFTTKPQGGGTGLGLFVVQAVVMSLGGRVEILDLPAPPPSPKDTLPLHVRSRTT